MDCEARTALFATPDLRVWRVRGTSSVCVVTFANYEERPTLNRPGFGEVFLAQHGIDAVHVVSRRNDWYQQPEMPAAVAAIRDAVSGCGSVFTYGSSMGGYAAIRFAGPLGAKAAIAISPQYTLDLREVPFERRWPEEARRIRFVPLPAAASLPPAFVFYDPHDPDRLHAAALARQRPVTALPIPYAGHPAATYMMETGLLGPAVFDILAGRFDPARFLREARERRRRSGQYLSILSAQQPQSRRGCKLALARLAARGTPASPHYASRLAGLLYRAGLFTDAEAEHRRALALMPGDPTLLFRYSLFLQRLRRFAEAADLAKQAVEADPSWAALRRHAAQSHRLAAWPALASPWLRLRNAALHGITLLAWRRGWPLTGRLERP